MGFSRQEYQSRLLCPSSKDLPKPENKSESLQSSALAGGFFTTSTTWDVPNYHYSIAICQQTSMWSSYGFSSSHVWMCELDHKKKKTKNKLTTKGLTLFNCNAGEDSWESLGLQGDQICQFWWKSILNIYWNSYCWSWGSSPLATWCKELTHWKRPWCWERLKAKGEEGGRGWDGLIASST